MNIVQEESLRDRKKSRRRALLIEIARGLIATKGLRSLKVRDVAEAADCSIGSVYNEFGDFDGLILTVNRETVQALTARLVAVPKSDPLRQLRLVSESDKRKELMDRIRRETDAFRASLNSDDPGKF